MNSQGAAQSLSWRTYFTSSQPGPQDLPWEDAYILSAPERLAIEKSIQQFQLGEGSEGRRLLNRGAAYGRAARDPHFVEALDLFVKEEQRHSAHLLRFMRRQRIPALAAHWVDSVFRLLRVLAGLELSLRVLVTAEIIAVPYYRALGRATGSPLLQAISARILDDEAMHLKFQSSMLSRLADRRRPFLGRLVWAVHRWFLIGTCHLVWAEHGSVFRAARYSFLRFLDEALEEISGLEAAAGSSLARQGATREARAR
jgi:hypothetical protein